MKYVSCLLALAMVAVFANVSYGAGMGMVCNVQQVALPPQATPQNLTQVTANRVFTPMAVAKAQVAVVKPKTGIDLVALKALNAPPVGVTIGTSGPAMVAGK